MNFYENHDSNKSAKDENNPIDDDRNWVDQAEAQILPEIKPKTEQKQFSEVQTSTLILVETAFLASAASLIWAIGGYFPIAQALRIFFPLPTALIYLRRGPRAANMSVLIAGLLLTVLVGPTRSILYVIPYGVMGLQLGFMWKRGASWGYSLILGTIVFTIGIFFRVWILSIMLAEDIWFYFISAFTSLAEWIFLKLGMLAVPSVTIIEAIALGAIVLNSLIYTFFVHAFALFIMDRLQNPIPDPPEWVKILLDYERDPRLQNKS